MVCFIGQIEVPMLDKTQMPAKHNDNKHSSDLRAYDQEQFVKIDVNHVICWHHFEYLAGLWYKEPVVIRACIW